MSRFDRAPSEADHWQLALLVVAVFALLVIVSIRLAVDAVPPVPPPSTSTPTITRTPIPLAQDPTDTPTPTDEPTLTPAEIETVVLGMNDTRTPAPPTPAVNPQTGGERANVGAGLAMLGGLVIIVTSVSYYLRIKKL